VKCQASLSLQKYNITFIFIQHWKRFYVKYEFNNAINKRIRWRYKMQKIISAVCLFILALVTSVRADELADLKQQVNELQQKVDRLEAKQNQPNTQDVNSTKQLGTLPENMKWVQNIKINGDFRYRFDSINEDGQEDRIRNRIRARLGITGKVNDEFDVILRIATAEPIANDKGNPIATTQTLDDAFSEKPIWLDQAYFKWSPKNTGLNVFGGKMANPFYRACNNQLIYDDDLQLEGIAAKYTRAIGENDEIFINGGGFWINEVSDGADTSLFGVQGGLKHPFGGKSTLTGGAGFYDYGNIEGSGALIGSGFQGNSNSGGRYISEYDIADVFCEYSFTLGKTPTTVFADYVKNTSASTSEDTGWLVGGKYGKCKDPGSWELSYDYRDIEVDAVLGAFNFSEFDGGGTNGKGHMVGCTYQLARNLQGALSCFLDEKGDDEHDYDRLVADLTFKF
jgi:hypothetical protein